MNNKIPLMRKIKHGVDIIFKDNKYTTPIAFEFTVGRDNKQVNIFDHHKKIFVVIKLVDTSTKMIITTGKAFEHPKEIPSGKVYVTHFPFMSSIQKQRKGFICYKIESELRLGKFKYGDKGIMHISIGTTTFVRFNKYNTYQEDSIGWFKYINSIITSQRTKREKLTDALFQVYITDEDMKGLSKRTKN